MALHAQLYHYYLKGEAFNLLRFQPYLTPNTTGQINNKLKRTSAIKVPVATMKITDDFHYEWKPSHATTKSTLYAISEDEWNTKEDVGTA